MTSAIRAYAEEADRTKQYQVDVENNKKENDELIKQLRNIKPDCM